VERRKKPRFPTRCPIRITLLGDKNRFINGTLLDISGDGVRISATEALPVDHPVRVDLDGGLLLGDVCYCRRDEHQGFIVGLSLAHSLDSVHHLAALMRSLDGEQSPAEDLQETKHRKP
jgi:hypothetical protein